jgi:sigma-E factor negative regulatory protein RseA
MNPLQESSREQISALADGALRGHAMARAVDALCADPVLQQVWQDHHALSDVMRTGAQRPCTDNAAFLSRFQQRLAAEAPLVAIKPVEPVSSVVPFPSRHAEQIAADAVSRTEAANEPVFRWKLVSGVASLAAVAAIGWNLVGGVGLPAADSRLAQQPLQSPVQTAAREMTSTPSVVQPMVVSASQPLQSIDATRVAAGVGEPQVMLRDARLDQLLEAHRQAGGAAQMPSGFLRNATFDGPSR